VILVFVLMRTGAARLSALTEVQKPPNMTWTAASSLSTITEHANDFRSMWTADIGGSLAPDLPNDMPSGIVGESHKTPQSTLREQPKTDASMTWFVLIKAKWAKEKIREKKDRKKFFFLIGWFLLDQEVQQPESQDQGETQHCHVDERYNDMESKTHFWSMVCLIRSASACGLTPPGAAMDAFPSDKYSSNSS
jgi:hypothetical protein